jgi:hypothetical protein
MFDVDAPTDEWRDEVYKDYAAPIVLHDVPGTRVARLATFGIVPRKHIPEGVRPFDTMNCRTETIALKRSFSSAWRATVACASVELLRCIACVLIGCDGVSLTLRRTSQNSKTQAKRAASNGGLPCLKQTPRIIHH